MGSGTSTGFAITYPANCLDVDRFQTLIDAATTAERRDPASAQGLARQAIALWRGEPYGALPDDLVASDERHRLWEQHRRARQIEATADLHLGRSANAIEPLRTLLVDDEGNELLRSALSLALYRCGSTDRAAEECTRGIHIAHSLGLEAVGFQVLQTQILNRDPALDWVTPAPITPHDLPREIADFTGRSALLADLTSKITVTEGQPPILNLFGPAGVGKTAFALRLAHSVADKFDGSLFLQMRAHAASPKSRTNALAEVLARVGAAQPSGGTTEDELAAALRSAFAERRLVAVFDDVGSTEDAMTLLPGAGKSLILITSRAPLAPLHGVLSVPIDRLSEEEAGRLLLRFVDAARATREAERFADLVRMCGASHSH